jgi:hypothetical protein
MNKIKTPYELGITYQQMIERKNKACLTGLVIGSIISIPILLIAMVTL